MKILMISSYLPYPLYSGGQIRLYNLIKELSQKHEITLICEKRHNQIEEHIEDLKKICKEVLVVERKKQWTISNILITGFSTMPFLMVGHTHQEMKNLIEKKLTETFDLIHVETFYIMQNIPKTQIPVVLAEHNIEYQVYQRFVKVVPFILQPFLMIDILKMKYWEEIFWKRATKLIAVSPFEQKRMKRNDVALVPNGVDLQAFTFEQKKKNEKVKKILFIGDFKWIQNKDAAKFIIKKIWPQIKQEAKSKKLEVKLWIVGRNIPGKIKKLGKNDEDIIFDENATYSTASVYKKADVLLAPIRVGGGTSYKILESMAVGLPVVTTTLGAQGIEARAEKEVLVANDAEGIGRAVMQLLIDDKLAQAIGKNARKLIEDKFNWKYIVKQLEKVYESAV